MTRCERDWQNICKNERKIEKAIYDCLNVNRKRFTLMRASGKFEMDIPGHKLVKAKTSFPLEAGEQVTIKASYSPFDANVDFGLITEDGVFHFLSVDSGSFDRTITVSERGNYTFAVRNNSSKTINVSGYVNY